MSPSPVPSGKPPFRKSFLVPIYGVKVILIVGEEILDLILSIDKAEAKEDHLETKAWTHMAWPKAHVLFKQSDLNFNSIGHEIDHLTHSIMREIGVTEDDKSDEAFAYMNGWLNDKIMILIEGEYKLEKK